MPAEPGLHAGEIGACVHVCTRPRPTNGARRGWTDRWSADRRVASGRGTQGESLPMRATVLQMVERLAAAGVGARPTVFICHRCGRRRCRGCA